MKFPIDDILALIPQKPPFVMVGKLLYTDENTTSSSFVIGADNVFVRNNLFQEAGLLENIAQTAALRAGFIAHAGNKPVAVGYIGAVKNFDVFKLPKVNDEIITDVTIETKVMDITVLTGKVKHNDELLAQCEMRVLTEKE
jgi:hypothetical protein